MERHERTTQQSDPQSSRWRRIRVFDRPQSDGSQAPSTTTIVMIVLALIVLIVLGIIIF